MSIAKHIVIILVAFHMANMQTLNIPLSDDNDSEMTDFEDTQMHDDFDKAEIVCHPPNFNNNCNVSPNHLYGYETIAWYFVKASKLCRPLWGVLDNNPCPENTRLPESETECQYLCLKKPCRAILPNGTASNINGYCTLEEYCTIDISHGGDKDSVGYNPCAHNDLICCPEP